MSEISTKPYFIRALFEWCNDSGYTPHLSVKVDERTIVPREHVREGEIVLNISPMATHRLSIENDRVSFQARFGGVARDLLIPVDRIASIYARETGQGMVFEVVDESPANLRVVTPRASDVEPDPPEPPAAPVAGGRPRLTRIK